MTNDPEDLSRTKSRPVEGASAGRREAWRFDPGQVVAERFRIVSLLGRGAMGEVFRAEDLRLGQTVALKFLPPAVAADPSAMRSLAAEVRIGRQISHPNVCRLYDLIEYGDVRFVSMEWIDGEDLASLLRRIGRPAVEKARDLGRQIAAGLGAAHDRGVTHRDLKPGNIMVDGEGAARVADFGLAIEAGEGRGMAGTPAYMAPEQFEGGQIGPHTDIYALGLVLWELFTGRRLYDADSLEGIRRQHRAPKGRPSTLASGIEPAIEETILRCLEEDPRRRPRSAREVGEQLAEGSAPPTTSSTSRSSSSPTAEHASIAVLPFEDFGGGDKDWFALGLADEIIGDLARIRSLRVISRGSAMRFRGAQECRPVAAELGVRYVLTGTVRRAGERLRVTASLVDGSDESLLWSGKFAGSGEDVFDIQEQIARSIAEELEVELSPEEVERLANRPIEDPIAYECYVRARELLWSYAGSRLESAVRLLKKGLAIAPDNVLLLATLGMVEWQFYNSGARPDESQLRRAETLARRIFELEPESHLGYRILGMVTASRGDLYGSVVHLRRVIELVPRDADSLGVLACVYAFTGLAEHARPVARRALELDPFGPLSQFAPIFGDWFAGRFESAVEGARRAGIFEPENPSFFYTLWVVLMLSGRKDEAALMTEMVDRMEDSTFTHLMRFHIAAVEDDRTTADKMAVQLEIPAKLDLQYSMNMAEGWALLGETDLALDWLDNAVERGFYAWEYLVKHDRFLEPLRGEPRFEEIVERARQRQDRIRELVARGA